jgi:phytoene synthase
MQTIDFGKIENLSLESGYSYCENIARQKNPFLFYVSRFFRDKNKFKAFCSSYASMRILDDFVDGISNRNNLSKVERNFCLNEIDRWEAQISYCHTGKDFENPILLALSDTFQNFNFSLTPWNKLAGAMRWDIEKFRFQTFEEFLEYTEGAAVAPATVFMYTLMAKRSGLMYDFAIKGVDPYFYTKDLAIFCYLTHILRDISSDLELEETGLVYLPLEDLNEFTISEDDLRQFKKSKAINLNFQKLMMYQIERARKYAEKGEELIKELYSKMDVDCRFILNLLVSLYKSTMDKIENAGYNVFISEHEMSRFEIFKTTFHNTRIHSFGKIKTIGFGLSLLKKAALKKIEGQC